MRQSGDDGLRRRVRFPTRRSQAVSVARRGSRGLIFFTSSLSGQCRRVEGFLAQVLQRRRNHAHVQASYSRRRARSSPTWSSASASRTSPTLVVVEGKHRARAARPPARLPRDRARCPRVPGCAEPRQPATLELAKRPSVRAAIPRPQPRASQSTVRLEVDRRGPRASLGRRSSRPATSNGSRYRHRRQRDTLRRRRFACATPSSGGKAPLTRRTSQVAVEIASSQ